MGEKGTKIIPSSLVKNLQNEAGPAIHARPGNPREAEVWIHILGPRLPPSARRRPRLSPLPDRILIR